MVTGSEYKRKQEITIDIAFTCLMIVDRKVGSEFHKREVREKKLFAIRNFKS